MLAAARALDKFDVMQMCLASGSAANKTLSEELCWRENLTSCLRNAALSQETAGSSPVVPAIPFKAVKSEWQ